MHTTNYSNTFIEVADDCKAEAGTAPPEKAERTIAQIQYELISKNPYRYTSDDVIFAAYAENTRSMRHGVQKNAPSISPKDKPVCAPRP